MISFEQNQITKENDYLSSLESQILLIFSDLGHPTTLIELYDLFPPHKSRGKTTKQTQFNRYVEMLYLIRDIKACLSANFIGTSLIKKQKLIQIQSQLSLITNNYRGLKTRSIEPKTIWARSRYIELKKPEISDDAIYLQIKEESIIKFPKSPYKTTRAVRAAIKR